MSSNLISQILKRIRSYFGRGSDFAQAQELVEFAVAHFADDFPNPRRDGCPPPETLTDMIRLRTLPAAETRDHLLSCSECFRHFQTELATQRRVESAILPTAKTFLLIPRRIVVPILSGVLVVILALTGAIWVILRIQSRRSSSTAERTLPKATSETPYPQDSQTGPLNSTADLGKRPQRKAEPDEDRDTSAKGSNDLAANKVAIDLETSDALRDASGVQRSAVVLRSATNEVTVKLPLGSPKGGYKLSLADPYGHPVRVAKAISEDGRSLKLDLPLALVKPGRYLFCVSRLEEVPDCVLALVEAPKER